MSVKTFFSKRINIILFVTAMFLILGLVLGYIVPNAIFNSRMKAIEDNMVETAYNYEDIEVVQGTTHLYIYDNGESTLLAPTGYIGMIEYEIEHHLIKWSTLQEGEAEFYYDDFQEEMFIYFIYKVADEFYVVTFENTLDAYTFTNTLRFYSILLTAILYLISLVLALTVVNSSLVKQHSFYDPISKLNTKLSLLNKYHNKVLTDYKVIYYNIYNFDAIVDACGIRYNDDILRMLSTNISNTYPFDSVYQLSNSEYVVISKEDLGHLEFRNIVNIRDERRMQIAPYEFRVKAITVNEEILSEMDIDTLIKRFNFAYSKIKTSKKLVTQVDKSTIKEMEEELYYRAHLGSAIKNKNLVNYYQPKIDPNTNQLVGAEALSRWIDNGKVVSPGKYIHIAETTGLIYDVDISAFDQAVQFIKYMKENNYLSEKFRLSSNFSPLTLKNLSFDTVKDILDKYEVSPKHISFEITESVVLEFELIQSLLEKLSSIGISIEIDDFSAGNSSFTVLPMLNADVVKLDRAVLPEKNEDEREKMIYRSLVDISKKLGFKIISEGVENEVQQNFVKELKVEGIQGYYYSRPLQKDDFCDFLNKQFKTTK